MEGLDDWLLAHGGACSRSVRLGESRWSGRGLYAARPVAGGDVLLVVPHALLLTATPRSHSVGALAKTDRLILALLEEAAAGSASRWAPYLRTLPPRRAFEESLPLMWAQRHVLSLCGPVLAERAAAQRADLRRRHAALCRVAGAASPSWSDFSWAAACVMSRSGDASDEPGDEAPALFPVGDLMNHHATYPNVLGRYEKSASAFTFTALRDVPEGEELTVMYGGLDDATLLLHYGMVWRAEEEEEGDEGEGSEEGEGEDEYEVEARDANPFDSVRLGARAVRAPSGEDAAWLRGLCEGGHPCGHHLTRDGPSEGLRALLRLANMNLGEQRAGGRARVARGEPVSDRNEALVWAAALELATSSLRTLRASRAAAGAAARAGALDGAVRLTARWRANQISVALAASHRCDEALAALAPGGVADAGRAGLRPRGVTRCTLAEACLV